MNEEHYAWPFLPDLQRLRQAFERAARHDEDAGFLLREIGGRLLERLDLLTLKPQMILDVGCGTGIITAQLMRKYRKARIFGLERSPAMVTRACRRAPWLRTLHGLCAEPEAIPLAEARFDLIFSNLALPWTVDLDRTLAEFRRLLKPGGALLFSTLGPDTLLELRRSWAAADERCTHVNAFLDLHDIGDALLRAGLAEPVTDVERLTLTYATVEGLADDLGRLGVRNVTLGRPSSLTGKGRWRAVREAYEHYRRPDGALPVSCEVVYGHAWGPLPRQDRDRRAEPAVFPLSRLRQR